jgi:2-keto-4-pentenoate hydratase/2-oxohepta-3-ene-1,7-dioic acid hydratase in catechol pathway
MRFVTVDDGSGIAKPGVLTPDGERVVDLGDRFRTLLDLIDAGDEGLAAARDAMGGQPARSLRDVRLLAPLPEPRSLRDCMVYEKHVRQSLAMALKLAGRDPGSMPVPDIWYRQPLYYKGNRFSVVGTDSVIRPPRYCRMLDIELEVAIVIGRKGRDIPPGQADAHIFGYMLFGDVTARDAQFAESAGGLGPAKGKDFDTGNVFGPWIVTPDELGAVDGLDVRLAVNGADVAVTTTADMHHDVPSVLAHISADETLHPGEVIALGTVGDCCLLEHGRSLAPGDTVDMTVGGLGTLRVTVGQDG